MSGFKVRDLARLQITSTARKSVTYRISCSGPCSKSYVGETGRGLETRLQEHKRDVRSHNVSNAMMLTLEHRQNLPAWDKAITVIEDNMCKPIRKAMDAAYTYSAGGDSERKARILYMVDGLSTVRR